jgi:hypothetical protein
MERFTGHDVQFFASDADQVRAVAQFVQEGIAASHTCIVVSTPERRKQVTEELRSRGIDVASLIARYEYIELDARTLLSSFLIDGRCDREHFHRMLDTLMRQASSRGAPVRAYGEMVSLLIEDGLPETAIELEELWNELTREQELRLFCGYSASAAAAPACSSRVRERICALHSHA